MSLDFATLTSVKKVRNLQHENLPIQDINFPTKNSKSPDLGSRMYHMYEKVVLDGQASDPVPVLSGVPQGSVLGLVLFLIFINDLPDNIRSSVRLFADDCVLYRNIKGEEK